MPPNRFESEVESFLEGSHGDRTHIKRADHHTVTPLCGTLLGADGGGPAEPSPNGGNGVIRATTRRRHAANQLLMLQNPHRIRCNERQTDLVGPAAAPADMAAVPVGGGSSTPGHMDGATAGQNSPSSPKMAQFGAFCPCMANFLPLSPPTSHAGRTLYRIQAGCGSSKHNNTTDHTSVKVSRGSNK